MNFDNINFSKIVSKLIKFKSGTTRIPINATSWEELIWITLVFMYGDKNVDWDSQSHEKSIDIEVKINSKIVKISAKGGTIKNNLLTVSSYRLTTFNTLDEKLEFIKNQHSKLDFYLICAREIKTDEIVYKIIKTLSDKMAPHWMTKEKNWEKIKYGYELKNDFDFSAKIVSKMSNQLWYSIPLDYFSSKEILAEIHIPKSDLGKDLVTFLKKQSK